MDNDMDIYTRDQAGRLCFSKDLFQHCMQEALCDDSLKVISARLDDSTYKTAIAEEKYDNKKLLGLYKYDVHYVTQGKEQKATILVKSKISYAEYLKILSGILIDAGIALPAETLSQLLDKTSIFNNMLKEIKIYQLALKNPKLANFLPKVYGTYVDKTEDKYLVLEAYLENVYLMHDYQDLSFWDSTKIIDALKDLAKFHAVYYAKTTGLNDDGWLGETMNTALMLKLKPLWLSMADNLTGLIPPAEMEQHYQLIESLPVWWPKIEQQTKTLIYNDIQIRNIAMEKQGDAWHLCLYDWEVATIHLPQRDLVEFLSYLITPEVSDSDLRDYFEISRVTLEKLSQQKIEPKTWLTGCLYALYDYQIDRLALQLNFHKVLQRVDIERVWKSSRRILAFLKNEVDADIAG
jgi:hypothetical protein